MNELTHVQPSSVQMAMNPMGPYDLGHLPGHPKSNPWLAGGAAFPPELIRRPQGLPKEGSVPSGGKNWATQQGQTS